MPKEIKEKRLHLVKTVDEKARDIYHIYNQDSEFLGSIEKKRVGSYMHWCYVFESKHIDYVQFSGGCWDEVREMIRNPEKVIEQQKMNKKQSCFKSNPSPQEQAENCCNTCPNANECFAK